MYVSLCDVLTPMSKALSTESANKICYDCIQIHGGTGYMHDFDSERLYRDARITNIYEGTTQLQVVAAIGGVMGRTLDGRIADMMAFIPDDGLYGELKGIVSGMLEKHRASIDYVAGMKQTAPDYRNLRARSLVENETFIYAGLLLLRDAKKDPARLAIAERYIRDAKFDFIRNYELIMSGDCTVIDRHEEVTAY